MPLSVKYGLDQHAPNLAMLGGDAVCGQRTLIVEFEGIYEFEIPKVRQRVATFNNDIPYQGKTRKWELRKYSAFGSRLTKAVCYFDTSLPLEATAGVVLITSGLSKEGWLSGLTCKTPDGSTMEDATPVINIRGRERGPIVWCKVKYDPHDEELDAVGLGHAKNATGAAKFRYYLENFAKHKTLEAAANGVTPADLLHDTTFSLLCSIMAVHDPSPDQHHYRGCLGIEVANESIRAAYMDAGYIVFDAKKAARQPNADPIDIYEVTIAATGNCSAPLASRQEMGMILTMPKCTKKELLGVLTECSSRMGSAGPLKLREYAARGADTFVDDLTEDTVLRYTGDTFGYSLMLAKDATVRPKSKGINTLGDRQSIHVLVSGRHQRISLAMAFKDAPVTVRGGYVEVDTPRYSSNGGMSVYVGKPNLDAMCVELALDALTLSELLRAGGRALQLPSDLDPSTLGLSHCLTIMLDRSYQYVIKSVAQARSHFMELLRKVDRLKQLAVITASASAAGQAGGSMLERLAASMVADSNAEVAEMQQLLGEVWTDLLAVYNQAVRSTGAAGYVPTWVTERAGRAAFSALGVRRSSDPGNHGARGNGRYGGNRFGGGRNGGGRNAGRGDPDNGANPSSTQQHQPSAGQHAPPPPAPRRSTSMAGGQQAGVASGPPQPPRAPSRATSLTHIPRGGDNLPLPANALPGAGGGNNQQASVLQVQNNALFDDDAMAGGGDQGGDGGDDAIMDDGVGEEEGNQRGGAGSSVQRSPPVHSAQRGGPRRRIEGGEHQGVHPGVRLEGRLAAEGLQPSPAAAPSGGGDGAAGSAPSGALALPPLPDDGDEEIEELE